MPKVSEDLAKKFAKEKTSAYQKWVEQEGLEIISAHYIPNLHHVELKPWSRREGYGVYVNHDSSRTSNDCYVCEIPPGGKLAPQKQIYEEMIYILDGRGSTAVWNDRGQRTTFEWQAGSLFAIPLNTWHQHFNTAGVMSARFLAVTNFPMVMNLFEDQEFVFNNPYEFKNRFNGEPDYFHPKETLSGFLLETNFVPNVRTLPLVEAKERGAGGGHIRFNLAKGTMNSHISEFPVGTYKKAHLHGPGAHVVILSGEGYSLMWPEGSSPNRYEWTEGSMVVPPDRWYHQHFNIGSSPARYLALKYEGTAIRNEQGVPKAWISKRLGGDQIDYVDENPLVRQWFEQSLRKHGLDSKMASYYDQERETLPPNA